MAHALHPDLQAKLLAYRAKRNFDANKWIDSKVAKFVDYLKTSNLSAACVSLSGGVDSAVTLGLIKRAQKVDGSPLKKVLAIAQPIHSSGWALGRAQECAKALDSDLIVVDQTLLHTQLANLVDTAAGVRGNPFAQGQLRSYMRTPVNYYVAQLLSQQGTPCIVMGTGNQDEDGYLAYFCKAGDGVVDVQLIADLHKSEVFKVGAALGVPDSILKAPPSADLWEGQTDEDELGFGYDFIELFTGGFLTLSESEQQAFVNSLSAEGKTEFEKSKKLAETIHRRNKHKLSSPHNINVLK
jgi:NAD+ synthase (glutamine-hydrolysing)